MQFKLKCTSLFVLFFKIILGQGAGISGVVIAENEPLIGATIFVAELGRGTRTDGKGAFTLTDLKPGTYSLRVSFSGYKSVFDRITLSSGEQKNVQFVLEPEVFNQSEVVVSATRNQIRRQDAPVIVNTISNRTFESTQSLSLAEGLSFSPGLRLENNCQNCGFTQLRMNGLDGAYSQILINSRPVFSSLAGVYGLEMLPANMVDRIEIVRGGGSVLFGGNAIAGTVNVITKDPIENSFEVGINQAFTNLDTPDRTLTFNASLVSEDLKKGITFFGFNRNRDPWDANADGFSELTKQKNTAFGFDAFWNVADRSKLKLGYYHINEFRRGGSDFDLVPHQSQLTEQVQHNINSLNTSFEHYSRNFKHKFSVYSALQFVDRDSYYGAGGRIITAEDSLTVEDLLAINAYGRSQDISFVGGVQYNYEISNRLQFTSGSEWIANQVEDKMPGYQRLIDQNVNTLGTYFQLEYKPVDKFTLLLGGRFDHLQIRGLYELSEQSFQNKRYVNVLVPRLTALYSLSDHWKLRTSFAQGYRGPQAFDEDLHIETVGGAARFIQLDNNLKTERSNSANASLSYQKIAGSTQMNFVIDGFYTQLLNPFILSNPIELPSGVAVITKRNGSGAHVYGTNLEANVAFQNKWIIQAGVTVQKARYAEEEEIWAPEDENDPTPATTTSRILRTPNTYGFLTFAYNPNKSWSFSYSAVYTGSMDVPHMIDPETEKTIIKSTPLFFENNFKISYNIMAKDGYRIQLFAGIQNLFNSYQGDFDFGVDRDAGYVYGPLRPRTVFFGLKFGLK